ncbi:MAG TPA: hypothetical protein VM369_08120 [Candidatus Binatia bacterium]|nr:hypothetical protein [Candidatus Binatia bacterium]
MSESQDVSYRRTERGDAEVKAKNLRLSPKLRAGLFFFDRPRTLADIEAIAQTLGLKPDFHNELVSLKLVALAGMGGAEGEAPAAAEPDDPLERYRMAHQFMNDTVVAALGLKSYLFVLKMERCATLADLRTLSEEHRAAIAKALDASRAQLIHAQLLRIIDGT